MPSAILPLVASSGETAGAAVDLTSPTVSVFGCIVSLQTRECGQGGQGTRQRHRPQPHDDVSQPMLCGRGPLATRASAFLRRVISQDSVAEITVKSAYFPLPAITPKKADG